MTAQTGLAVSRDGSNNGTLPKGHRLATGGLLAKNGASGLDVRRGVLWDGLGSVVTGTAGMSYSVRSCNAVVMLSATQGPIIVPNDATVAVPTTAAPGANSRIDIIWVRQHLVAADGGADTDVVAEIGVTQGAVAGVPSAPAIPTGAVELARATVPAGTTATNTLTIQQTHLWTVTDGAPIPVRNDTERDALTEFDGMLVNHLGSDQLQRFDGSVWRPLSTADVRHGDVEMTILAGQTSGDETVDFVPAFASAPHVVGMPVGTGTGYFVALVSDPTTSAAEFTFKRQSGASTASPVTQLVHWIAVG